jgi:hypothetical protein
MSNLPASVLPRLASIDRSQLLLHTVDVERLINGLLEVCQIFGTLIADEQQICDLNYLDEQLVLGITWWSGPRSTVRIADDQLGIRRESVPRPASTNLQ